MGETSGDPRCSMLLFQRRVRLLVALCLAALGTMLPVTSARAGSVNFQGVNYSVTTITYANNVPPVGTNDLIFVVLPTGQKVIAIPTDTTARGTFDPFTQRFYMLNRSTGEIDTFSSIDATLINLDGTVFSTTSQSPSAPLETFSKPLGIAETGTDVCIINSSLIGYRTDGPTITDEKIYAITRQATSTVVTTTPVSLKNADMNNNNLSVFVEFDANNNTFLTSQLSLDVNNNTDVRDRISAINPDGSIADQIILANNPNITGYVGGEEAITVDPTTDAIYLSASNMIFVFTPQLPALASIKPNTGSILGGTVVTLTGSNFPTDAAVFFDGVAAGAVSVVSGATIQATTPSHAAGAVDVTVTGTGIPSSTPLLLSGAFTYIDLPPTVVLAASPTQGLPPLNVFFDTTGTLDSDGTLSSRILDFGDGAQYVFPANGGTQISHTYLSKGTFTATLTVRDNADLVSTAVQQILVGSDGQLMLGQLSIQQGKSKDTVKLTGQIEVPGGTTTANATLTVGLVNPESGQLTVCPSTGGFTNIVLGDGTNVGGQFCSKISGLGNASAGNIKASLKAPKKPSKSASVSTNSTIMNLTFMASAMLDDALNGAVDNLVKDDSGNPLTTEELNAKRSGKVLIVVRIDTPDGDSLQFSKLAVVAIDPGHNSIKFTRK